MEVKDKTIEEQREADEWVRRECEEDAKQDKFEYEREHPEAKRVIKFDRW